MHQIFCVAARDGYLLVDLLLLLSFVRIEIYIYHGPTLDGRFYNYKSSESRCGKLVQHYGDIIK